MNKYVGFIVLDLFLGLNVDMLSRILNLLCSKAGGWGVFNFKEMKLIYC